MQINVTIQYQFMTKKDISKFEDAMAKWNDTISEDQVIEKLGVSEVTLRRMRKAGEIKNFRFVTTSKTGNPGRPGKRIVYSLVELSEKFSPTV